MSQYNYKAGLRNVGSYQASGLPYVSGGIDARGTDGITIKFPAVTRWITVSNIPTGEEVRVAFSANGVVNTEYFELPGATVSPRLEMRVTAVHLSGSSNVSLMAGLTSIGVEAINNADLFYWRSSRIEEGD